MRNQYFRVLLISTLVMCGFWALGYYLAPNKAAFIYDHSWLYQLFWFPSHVFLAYFSWLVYKKAAFGKRHQDITFRSIVDDFNKNYRVIITAILLIAPFMVQDFVEGLGELNRDYESLGNATWVMIGPVWMIEWIMLAVMWSRVMASIKLTINFYTPKYVRENLDALLVVNTTSPLLQVGVENALINLFYAITTIGYIEFAGGELADYQNVAISAILVLSSFLVSFFYVRKRIGDALEHLVAEHSSRLEGIYGHHHPELIQSDLLSKKLDFQLINHFVFDKTGGLSRRAYERLTIVRSSLLIESIQKNGYADSLAVQDGIKVMQYTQYEVRLASLGIEELKGVIIRLGSPAVMYLLKSGVLTS